MRTIGPIALIVIVLSILTWAAMALAPTSVTQPIAFNHKQHTEDAGLDCVDCHVQAENGVRATIPNIETCAGCHEEMQGESANEALVVEHIRDNDRIPWRKIYWVPPHVYFSHRRHVAIGGIDCEVCHGDVGEQTEPLTRRLVKMSMNDCMKCHDKTGVTNDCVACHL